MTASERSAPNGQKECNVVDLNSPDWCGACAVAWASCRPLPAGHKVKESITDV